VDTLKKGASVFDPNAHRPSAAAPHPERRDKTSTSPENLDSDFPRNRRSHLRLLLVEWTVSVKEQRDGVLVGVGTT
jgi:hypothetical protein